MLTAQDRGPFWFSYILNEIFYNMLKCGMNLKFETIVQIFRKIIRLNAVIILKSTNEYCRKIISKSGFKMYLYPAMIAYAKIWNLWKIIMLIFQLEFSQNVTVERREILESVKTSVKSNFKMWKLSRFL